MLIALEGIDGSGKTTLARALAERLSAHGYSTTLCLNRSLKRVGRALDDVASSEGFSDRFEMLGAGPAQFMAAVLKWRELLELEPHLARGDHVVVIDKYFYTHLARAAVYEPENVRPLRRLFSNLPAPDVGLFVDVSPQVAAERIRARGLDTEALEFLTQFRRGYRGLPDLGAFASLDGDAEPLSVLSQAWDVVASAATLPVPTSSPAPTASSS